MTTKKPTTKPEPVTALAVQTAATREINPSIWNMIKEISHVVYRGYGFSHPDNAAAVMLKGYEVGFGIAASIEFIQSIAGKPPTVSPKGAMALLHTSPLIKRIEINRLTDKGGAFVGYSCTMERNTGFAHTSQFTMEDAKRAGLVKPDSGWMKYPENMCLWRAIGFAADVVAPDVTAGMTALMKMPEAYGVALTESGDVVDAPTFDSALSDLEKEFGAEKIYNVYGTIPQTFEQIAEVRKTLYANNGRTEKVQEELQNNTQ